MAESASSSYDTSRVAENRMSAEADPTARRGNDLKKLRELDRLLAQFDNYFPGFVGAVLKMTQKK
jgi:hypothetical protein